jgi:MFS transporter, DHA1 family, inner membrane transport protein
MDVAPGPRAMASAMLLATLANMCIGMAPVSMGAMVQAGHLAITEVGRVATVEMLALTLGSALAPMLLRGGGFRVKVGLIAIGLVALDLATFLADSVAGVYIARGLAGLLEGGVMACLMLLVVRSRDPERMDSIYLAVSTIPQVFTNYALTAWLIPRFGPAAGFGVMAALAAVGAVVSVNLPGTIAQTAHDDMAGAPGRLALSARIVLLMTLLHNAAIGCVWYYLERLATMNGARAVTAGMIVNLFLIAQLAGAGSAAMWKPFGRRRFGLVEISLGLMLVTLAMPFAGSLAGLSLCVIAYGAFQILLGPLALRILVDADPGGRAGEQLMTMTLLGLALGSFAASLFVQETTVIGGYIAGACLMALGGGAGTLAILAAPGRKRKTGLMPRPAD